jgi:type IV pilus assembly protein PilC
MCRLNIENASPAAEVYPREPSRRGLSNQAVCAVCDHATAGIRARKVFMSNYSYVAVDPQGMESRGTLDVADQTEAVRRIKEMGLFPTKVLAERPRGPRGVQGGVRRRAEPALRPRRFVGWGGRISAATLTVFTRQLATLVEAGMPLVRGLRILQEQAESRALRRVIGELSASIENGSSFAEALALRPRIFNRLYENMVKAGEISGALEITLRRLADFMEKAQKIKGKIKAAMYYPCAVLCVAVAILTLLMTYVVPRFKAVLEGLLNGGAMPTFTMFVLRLSEAVTRHILLLAVAAAALGMAATLIPQTRWGRQFFDSMKLTVPLFGPIFRRAAISRFARTLGTLMSSGVPILQALTIVKETAGNVVVGRVIFDVHQRVKEGDPIAPGLRASSVFPVMVAGMVDVGEQTGALPEMLMKIADTYDEEVDNSVTAMTSLLEPIMIVLLAVIVGSIVIALFLPLFGFNPDGPANGRGQIDA